MTFWGIEVKPSKPYTHSSSKDGTGGRLRISQATLAIGKATLKTLVQCNVGDKRPVLLCVLMPNKTESLQLDLEFDEAEDVTFSCIGPRGVYLTGYYVGHNRHSVMPDDSESYGEDIANSETMESNQGSDEDEYEDSFIDDDEPLPSSPALSSEDDDDEDEDFLKKKRNGNGGHRRLKKRYQAIESDDEMSVQDVDDEDTIPISTICKNKKSQASGEKPKKETIIVLDEEPKSNDANNKSDAVNSPDVELKSKTDVDIVGSKTEREDDQPNVPSESKSKTKKKKRESSKDKKATDLKEDQPEQNGVKTKKKRKDRTKKENAVEADDEKPIDMGVGESLEVQASAEAVPEKKKRKRKGHSEASDLDAGTKQEGDQQAIDKSSDIDRNQLANGSQSDEKKAKKKKRKTSKTQEGDENTNINVEKENKKISATKPEEKESELCNKKTLSNGLVIEDLKTGKSKGKVAAAGKKVKVQYVVTLKENGQVIDSNGKSPYKFRLGDKEVIEGLNVGLEGMQVGDRRKLTIPPSMSVGFKGTAENVPPNSWLVYDVEMTSIH